MVYITGDHDVNCMLSSDIYCTCCLDNLPLPYKCNYWLIFQSNHVVKEKQNTNILRVVIHSSMHKDDNNTQLMDLVKYISSCQAFRNKYKIKLKRFTNTMNAMYTTTYTYNNRRE